jgi:hypothetical protein
MQKYFEKHSSLHKAMSNGKGIRLKLPRTEDRKIHHSKATKYLTKIEAKIEPGVAHQDLALATYGQLLLKVFRKTHDQNLLMNAKDRIDKALNTCHPGSGQGARYVLQRGLILTTSNQALRVQNNCLFATPGPPTLKFVCTVP